MGLLLVCVWFVWLRCISGVLVCECCVDWLGLLFICWMWFYFARWLIGFDIGVWCVDCRLWVVSSVALGVFWLLVILWFGRCRCCCLL